MVFQWATSFTCRKRMQNSTGTIEDGNKANQLLTQIISKTAQIIVQSRFKSENATTGKKNKWFNLELEDLEFVKQDLKFWKGQINGSGFVPPLLIDIFLDISPANGDNLILYDNSTGRRVRIKPDALISTDLAGKPTKKDRILLETWKLTLS